MRRFFGVRPHGLQPMLIPYSVGSNIMAIVKRFFLWFFARPSEPPSWLEIIAWWEIRRIPYNLIIGSVGMVSLLLFFVFIHLANELKPGEDAIEPLGLLAAPFAVNICYTAGWIVELLLSAVRRRRSSVCGPALLKLGVGFSLFVVLLPSTFWFVIWIARG